MLPPLEETLVPLDLRKPQMNVLELDELWSFVRKKANKVWVWLALCRATRQIVAVVLGDRSEATCRKLWEAIPKSYRRSHCFSDFWDAYAKVIPTEQHIACGKETGLTAHIERFNNTLRQRLARFVRKTLSFSKSVQMHEACLLLFIHRYNREKAELWKRFYPS
jgi:insertion element IS1 protein InsB